MTDAKRKTMIREGDRTDIYIPGEFVVFKWGRRWKVIAARYDARKDATYIRLEKESTHENE